MRHLNWIGTAILTCPVSCSPALSSLDLPTVTRAELRLCHDTVVQGEKRWSLVFLPELDETAEIIQPTFQPGAPLVSAVLLEAEQWQDKADCLTYCGLKLTEAERTQLQSAKKMCVEWDARLQLPGEVPLTLDYTKGSIAYRGQSRLLILNSEDDR